MIHVTIDELEDLRSSIFTLEAVLETLDQIGAGIAAIHVDAAINQLKNNLEVIGRSNATPVPMHKACQSECPPYTP